ncbi:MAG: squalene/phytoene synthase family protein [Parvularculaceae bacterium]
MTLPDAAADPVAYCRAEVAAADEDLSLSLNYAPAADRPRLAALFALLVELRRIPAAVSEAPLGEIRLQWHREALDEIASGRRPRAHPVVMALAAAGAVPAWRATLEKMIDARARLLYEPRFATLDELSGFLAAAEAPVAALALGDADADQKEAARALGLAHALARLSPALTPALAGEAARAALDLRARAAPMLAALPGAAFGRIAYLALVRGHAARPGGERWPVLKRLALFRAVAAGRF